ncbi:MAG: outer membrane lipoprotein-sorting protein, partial [Treponema sp.]|nr:outer membrane lipoprotein-sorting protein [Treponema sp.]
SSQYSYRISWVTKDAWIPTYIEMYDKKGKLLKVNEIKALKKVPGTNNRVYNVPMENVMTNVQTKHATSMKMVNITVDQPLPDRTFTTDFLLTGK